MSTQKSSQYILFLRQPAGPTPPPEELQQIMAKFVAWIGELQRRGEFAGTERLGLESRVLYPPQRARPSDGPFIEAKEIVGGFIKINARSLDHAAEIAAGCPGIAHGLTVEVRPVLA